MRYMIKGERKQLNVWISKETKDKFDETTSQNLNKYEIIDFLIRKWLSDDKLKEEFKKLSKKT